MKNQLFDLTGRTAVVTGALGKEQGSRGALFRLDLRGAKGLVILPKRK